MSRRSGLADSPLFRTPPPPQAPDASKLDVAHQAAQATQEARKQPAARHEPRPKEERQPDTMPPRHPDTTPPRYHDTLIERIRKAVKAFGKEAATHRFTAEEKQAIAGIIYAYKNQGVKTSENEIARIAVNFIVKDHRDNEKESLLNRVLKALHE